VDWFQIRIDQKQKTKNKNRRKWLKLIFEWGWSYVRASLLVLVIGIGSTVEKKLGAIGATERDGVKVVIKALIRPWIVVKLLLIMAAPTTVALIKIQMIKKSDRPMGRRGESDGPTGHASLRLNKLVLDND
jgi:hypothetical protein